MFHKFLYVLIITMLSGCMSTSPQAPEYPAWYNKPLVDNDNFYGVSKAENKKSAKSMATNMIMANILITIQKTDKRYSEVEEVKKLAPFVYLNDVEVTKDEEVFNEIKDATEYVLEVAVKQSILFENEKKELDKRFNRLDKALTSLDEKAHTLSQFASLSKYEKESKDMDKLLSVIRVIKPSFSTKKYEDILFKYEDKMVALRLSLAIKIFSDADALKYIQVIQEAFAQREIVTLITSPSVTENVTLKMSTQEQRYESHNYKMVKIQLELNFYDNSKKLLFSHNLILSGKSKESYREAKIDSAKYLKNLIKTRGFFESMGI